MITEDYVSFEVASYFKEKGFDIECNTAYYNGSLIDYTMYGFCVDGEFIFAPTYQMAMKWLREKHIIIVVQPEYFNAGEECSYWGVDIWADDNYEKLQGDFPSYEQAVEAAIKYCLENLI